MNAEYDRLLGQNLRLIRVGKQLTQEQIAARLQLAGCDMTRSAYAKIEAGQRHLYPDELYALRIALDVSYESLLPPPDAMDET